MTGFTTLRDRLTKAATELRASSTGHEAANQSAPVPTQVLSASDVLAAAAVGPTAEQRVAMTVSCQDCNTIPKVSGAGEYGESDGLPTQLMHNGLEMVRGGYYGDWMAGIISQLRGHHEPQEELVFHQILERINHAKPAMMELGCFWAYYSLWFLKRFPNGVAVAAEPDPDHLSVGVENAKLNSLAPRFHNCAAGAATGDTLLLASELNPGVEHRVKVTSVADLLAQESLDRLDLLHMDIQGAELAALKSAKDLFVSGAVRFVVVSTHHHLISNDPLTHQRCLAWLQDVGANVICEHSVSESFSGDGLIAVSFDSQDREFTVDVSHNRASTALFQAPDHDLAALAEAYEDLRQTAALRQL